MTNYNERLDKALKQLAVAGRGWGVSESVQIESMSSELDEAKQAIISLNKELVAEAKPKAGKSKSAVVLSRVDFSASAINQYEQNILKALEEV